jgi:predicted kinase
MTDEDILEDIGKLKEQRSLFILLVGPPGCGKSTFAQKLDSKYKMKIYSIDRMIGANSDAHLARLRTIESQKRELAMSMMINRSIVVDRLNMTTKVRALHLPIVPHHYWCVAVDLNSVPFEELHRRVQARPARGRRIPDEVIQDALKRYEPPQFKEGFDYIYRRSASN